MRALLNSRQDKDFGERFDEQIERMDEIVRYQLRKPAASVADNLVLAPVPVEKEVTRLIDGLRKVYRDKHPEFEVRIEKGMQFRGDTGDFLELVGDDGPGIPQDAADALLQRGMRLDESTPGHGIGLAVVKDIARSYGGRLSIKTSDLGGAEIMVSIPPVTTAKGQ
jgi:two-component system sensor histidine kinase PhoQ